MLVQLDFFLQSCTYPKVGLKPVNRATRSRSRVDDRLQDDHFFIMEVRTAAQLLEADWQLKFTVRRCRVES